MPCEHVWTQVLHLDGCHSYQSEYKCAKGCGAIRMTWAERKLRPPNYSPMAYPEGCPRCRELIGGARRKNRIDTTAEPPRV